MAVWLLDGGWLPRLPLIDLSWSVRAFLSHFSLGFGVGLLLCVLILTILRCCGATRTEELRIRRSLFWLALSVSIMAHVLEDYLLGWF